MEMETVVIEVPCRGSSTT